MLFIYCFPPACSDDERSAGNPWTCYQVCLVWVCLLMKLKSEDGWSPCKLIHELIRTGKSRPPWNPGLLTGITFLLNPRWTPTAGFPCCPSLGDADSSWKECPDPTAGALHPHCGADSHLWFSPLTPWASCVTESEIFPGTLLQELF